MSYGTYGIVAWGQAIQSHLNKIFILQKRALRFMHFTNNRRHTIPYLFPKTLPIKYTLL